jgi:hypothetical protein
VLGVHFPNLDVDDGLFGQQAEMGFRPVVDHKRVCFHLTRVILAQVELGIEGEFRPTDDPRQARDVSPLRCGG